MDCGLTPLHNIFEASGSGFGAPSRYGYFSVGVSIILRLAVGPSINFGPSTPTRTCVHTIRLVSEVKYSGGSTADRGGDYLAVFDRIVQASRIATAEINIAELTKLAVRIGASYSLSSKGHASLRRRTKCTPNTLAQLPHSSAHARVDTPVDAPPAPPLSACLLALLTQWSLHRATRCCCASSEA